MTICLTCIGFSPRSAVTDPRPAKPGAGDVCPGLSQGFSMLKDDEPLSFTERVDNARQRRRPRPTADRPTICDRFNEGMERQG